MKTKLLGLYGCLLTCMALPLGAQDLTATFLKIDPGKVAFAKIVGGPAGYIRAGELDFVEFSGFCTDPFQEISSGETIVYSVQNPATLNELGTVRRILDGYYNHSAQTALDAAGAQWAIWEVIEDGATSPSFKDGTVRISAYSNSVANRALDYLADLTNYDPVPVQHLVSKTHQDVIVVVPEPGTTSLLAGILGLLVLRRRRR